MFLVTSSDLTISRVHRNIGIFSVTSTVLILERRKVRSRRYEPQKFKSVVMKRNGYINTSTTSGLEQICFNSAIFIRRWSWKNVQVYNITTSNTKKVNLNVEETNNRVLQIWTFFFLLEIPPFSFWRASCSSSSSSESTFFFAAVSVAFSSFLRISCKKIFDGINIEFFTWHKESERGNSFFWNSCYTSEAGSSLKLNFSKTFLNSSSITPSSSAFSGIYSTSTGSKAFTKAQEKRLISTKQFNSITNYHLVKNGTSTSLRINLQSYDTKYKDKMLTWTIGDIIFKK